MIRTKSSPLNADAGDGDSVLLNGSAIVENEGGNAKITGLDEAGEIVVIKDNTNTSENKKVTYEVIAMRVNNAVVRKQVGDTGEYTYWDVAADTVVTDDSSAMKEFREAIVTSDYPDEGTTYFLNNGLPYANANNAAAILSVDAKGAKTLQVKSAILESVVAENDTVKIEDTGTTATAYKLAATSNILANGVTFTTTRGVVSAAQGVLILAGNTDSLVADGTVNVNASALLETDATGTTTMWQTRCITLFPQV